MKYFISDCRKKKELTQVDLADAASISVASLRRYENNDSEPKMSILLKIANVLEVDLSQLITPPEDDENSNLEKNKKDTE